MLRLWFYSFCFSAPLVGLAFDGPCSASISVCVCEFAEKTNEKLYAMECSIVSTMAFIKWRKYGSNEIYYACATYTCDPETSETSAKERKMGKKEQTETGTVPKCPEIKSSYVKITLCFHVRAPNIWEAGRGGGEQKRTVSRCSRICFEMNGEQLFLFFVVFVFFFRTLACYCRCDPFETYYFSAYTFSTC